MELQPIKTVKSVTAAVQVTSGREDTVTSRFCENRRRRNIPVKQIGRAEMRVWSVRAPQFGRNSRAFPDPPAQFLQFGQLRIEIFRAVYKKRVEEVCQHDRAPLFDQ
jgi:hypothetical protein